jgi:hypothetical protein
MTIPVLIEANPSGGFTAKLGPPFNWTADGVTADAAKSALRAEIAVACQSGLIDDIEIPVAIHATQAAGCLKDCKEFDEWVDEIAAARAVMDADQGKV